MGYLSYSLMRKTSSGERVYFETDTGMPYIFLDKKIYVDVNRDSILPEKIRQFAVLNGPHFRCYYDVVRQWTYYDVDIDNAILAKHYPSWESIEGKEELANHGWDETKHNGFKEFLDWSNAQGGFIGDWSY